MNILLVMIPLSILFALGAGIAFFWAVDHDQFDDLDTPKFTPLLDDPAPEQTPSESGSAESASPRAASSEGAEGSVVARSMRDGCNEDAAAAQDAQGEGAWGSAESHAVHDDQVQSRIGDCTSADRRSDTASGSRAQTDAHALSSQPPRS